MISSPCIPETINMHTHSQYCPSNSNVQNQYSLAKGSNSSIQFDEYTSLDTIISYVKNQLMSKNYVYLDNVKEFQKDYKRTIEQQNDLLPPCRLADYDIFDISTMHPPKKVKGTKGSFFACFARQGLIPYRITIPLPGKEIHYDPLDYCDQ